MKIFTTYFNFFCKITYLLPIWACKIFNLYLPVGRNFFTYFGFFSVYPISIYRYWLSRGGGPRSGGTLGICLPGWLGRYGSAASPNRARRELIANRSLRACLLSRLDCAFAFPRLWNAQASAIPTGCRRHCRERASERVAVTDLRARKADTFPTALTAPQSLIH